MLVSQDALTCDDAAKVLSKIVNAVDEGHAPPKVNARVFGTAADGSDDFMEVVIEGKKLRGYKNGKLIDVDPKDVKTMRAFVKDAKGRRVHAFITSPEKGQKAVDGFFQGVATGKLDPSDAKSLGNKFVKMSEMDQATLVGGIENKLRQGKQITEAEFLIAVKGTPSFRTLKGAAPHLEDLQKAFRSGNLDDSLKIVDKSWNASTASADTQGRVARIQNLLGNNHLNKPADMIADSRAGQKLIGASDNVDDVKLLPAKKTGADLVDTTKPRVTGGNGNIKVDAYDAVTGKKIDAELIVDTKNKITRPAKDITPGTGTRAGQKLIGATDNVDDVKLLPAKTTGTDLVDTTKKGSTDLVDTTKQRTTGGAGKGAGTINEKGNIRVDAWDAKTGKKIDAELIVDTKNKVTRPAKDITPGAGTIDDSVDALASKKASTLVLHTDDAAKTGTKTRALATTGDKLSDSKALAIRKTTAVAVYGDDVIDISASAVKGKRFLNVKKVALLLGSAALLKVAYDKCSDNPACKRFLDSIRALATGEKTPEEFAKEMEAYGLHVDVNKQEDNSIKCTWSLKKKDDSKDGEIPSDVINDYLKADNGYSVSWHLMTPEAAPQLVIKCEGTNKDCIIDKDAAQSKTLKVQYDAVYSKPEGAEKNSNCNNQGDTGQDTVVVPDKDPDKDPVKDPVKEPVKDEDTDDDEADDEADDEEKEEDAVEGYNFDPFGIIQGDLGKKAPLVPPQPMMIPPDNNGMYVSPGYY